MGKLGSRFLETWWGKGNLLWSIRKREGGAIVVNHGILFAGRRHPYFRLDVLRCSLFLAPLGQKKEEGPQLDFRRFIIREIKIEGEGPPRLS